jgi:hypothetical protein
MMKFIAGAAIGFGAAFGAAAAAGASPLEADFSPNPSVGWLAHAGEFIQPPSGQGPLREDPAHPHVTNDEFRATGKQPTTPVPDLNSPLLQPWVKEVLRKRDEQIFAGHDIVRPAASCWPSGVPAFVLRAPALPFFFIQGPKEVVIIWQGDHQVRHVYLTDKHPAHIELSWYGDAIGHYEGDTLVVDTIGLNTKTFVDNFDTPHSDKEHVVERFHMIDKGMTLEDDVHVEDPGAFTVPWNAIQRFRRVEPGVAENKEPASPVSSSGLAGPLLEQACAENPVTYFGGDALPIPQADKPDF